jgi:RNA 2',3'-cyclic 3'-phosphodiesterase
MRLFVGIDISDEIRQRVSDYITDVKRIAPDAKWVQPESLHLTLKFIGESQRQVEIEDALSTVKASRFQVSIQRVGFFTQRSPRVFWAGVDGGPLLSSLATSVEKALITVDIPSEDHEYHPHLTLARTGSGRPQGEAKDRNRPKMYLLREKIMAEPRLSNFNFGTMLAEEFFLYRSETLPTGPRYTKLSRFDLQST